MFPSPTKQVVPHVRVARTACLARLLAVYSLPAVYSRRRLFFSACRSAPSRFALAAQRAFGWLLLLLLLHAVLLLLSALRSLFSQLVLSSLVFFSGAFKYTDTMRPALPSKDELKDVQELLKASKVGSGEKNFITSNAVENILAVPKREEDGVDWLKKPYFGEVPPYLTKIKQEIKDEYEYIKSMQEQQAMEGPSGMRLMGEDEISGLVIELKKKWGQVNNLYQASSVLSLASLDTIGKVKRKEMYEAQLAQIEKDIEKLSKKQVYLMD